MTSPAAWGDSPETTWTDAAGNRRLYDPDLDDNYPGTYSDRGDPYAPPEGPEGPEGPPGGREPETQGSPRVDRPNPAWGPAASSDSPKKTHLVKTNIWGTKTYHDPKTGKQIKKTNPKAEKLKKQGWF